MAGIEVHAVEKHIRMSARKVRLVADAVRGRRVREALALLRLLPHKAAEPVAKAIQSAAANAETTFNLDPEDLVVARISADGAKSLKRYRRKARGRVGPILKRSSHIRVVVEEKEA